MSNPIYSQSFEGIVTVITNIIETVSGVGTTSFTLSPDGYPSNFGGVVSALADLNSTISGISAGGDVLRGTGDCQRGTGGKVENADLRESSRDKFLVLSRVPCRSGPHEHDHVKGTLKHKGTNRSGQSEPVALPHCCTPKRSPA